MRSRSALSLLLVFQFVLIFSVDAQNYKYNKIDIKPGWSKNSINATIFRKTSIVSHNGYQYVSFYDSTAHVVLAKRKLGEGKWQIKQTDFTGNIKDAHNVISIMIDCDGYLHLAWDHHNSPLHYAISKEPGSLEMRRPSNMLGENEKIVSYPEFYRLDNGNLIFAYRDGGSGNGNLVLNKYDISNKKWERLHSNLIDGEGKRNAYWQIFTEGNSIHISWVWRESPNVASNHDMCYAKSNDGGITWSNSKNEPYTIPINIQSAEKVCDIPQNSNLINQTSLTVSKGIPYIVTYFKRPEDNCTQFYVIYQQNNDWKLSKATNRTLDFDLSGGGSRSIPISRPQIIHKNSFLKKPQLYVIFRDEEFDNAILISKGKINKTEIEWDTKNLTNFSVDRWEPSFDSELWKTKHKLHIYSHKVGQGQGETSVSMPAQMVSVLEVEL